MTAFADLLSDRDRQRLAELAAEVKPAVPDASRRARERVPPWRDADDRRGTRALASTSGRPRRRRAA
ncbi:MAG: hypothetical protein WAK82_25035 [Streptosporangiaceae bacterium]